MGNIKPPCMDCTKRHETCHIDCKDYLDYKAEIKKQNEKRDYERSIEYWTPRKKRRRW